MSGMTRLGIGVTLTLVVGFAIATASSAAGSLKCGAGAPATCSVSGETATFDTSSGGFAFAYYTNSKANGSSLADVDYSFRYNCDPLDDMVSCTGGGSPRWSIPINTDQDGTVEGYAFLDANGCGDTGTVTTTSSACAVNFQGVDYANWDAFAAANPTYQIGHAVPFVITDTTEPGTTLIFAIEVTK